MRAMSCDSPLELWQQHLLLPLTSSFFITQRRHWIERERYLLFVSFYPVILLREGSHW